MMMALFHLWPGQVYRFSTRKLLPGKKNRFSKAMRSAVPYELLESKTHQVPRMKEINIVGRGVTFSLNQLKSITGPTFLVPFWVPLKIDENENIIYPHRSQQDSTLSKYKSGTSHKYFHKEVDSLKNFKKENLIYSISREQYVKDLIKKDYKVLCFETYGTDENGKLYPIDKNWNSASYLSIFENSSCMRIAVAEKIYKPPLLDPHLDWTPTGSMLPAICALSYFADKINIYGWDFYLKSTPEKMNFWEIFFSMYNSKLDLLRSRNYFESALINYYYAYQLSKLPNINIHGHLGQLGKHEKLMKRIEKVLFN